MTAARSSSVQLDRQGLLRCTEPRRNNPSIECDTTIARPSDDRLEVRCRSCGAVHVFGIDGGAIVAIGTKTSSALTLADTRP